ncbi:MAG: HEAT repeat domain-containing protein [Planctomycetota bacterium]
MTAAMLPVNICAKDPAKVSAKIASLGFLISLAGLCLFVSGQTAMAGLAEQAGQADQTGASDREGKAKSLEDLFNELVAREDTVFAEAAASLTGLDTAVIETLIRYMAGDDHDQAKAAHVALSAFVHRLCVPERKEARTQAADALIRALDGPWPANLKHPLLRLIAFSATAEHVPGLAAKINDRDVGERVVWALSRIPGDTARKALEKALVSASPERKVPLIQAVARYGHPDSGNVLALFMEDSDPAVRTACLDSLVDVMDPQAMDLLVNLIGKDAGEAGRRALRHLAEVADRLVEKGQPEEASMIYEKLYHDCPGSWVRCAGLLGLARVEGPVSLPVLRSALLQGLPDVAGAAVFALSSMGGEDKIDFLIEAVSSDQCPVREHVARALADCAVSAPRMDAVYASLMKAYEIDDTALKFAVCDALSVLGNHGHAQSIDKVVELTACEETLLRDAAFQALNRLRGPETTRVLLASLAADLGDADRENALPARAVPLIDALGIRGDERALESLVQAVRDPCEAVRIASLRALGRLNVEGAAPVLFEESVWGGEAEQEEACHALYRLDDPKATARIIALLGDAPDAARARVLAALGRRKDPMLAPLFLEALQAVSVDVVVAGLDALGRLQDPACIPDLLEVVDQGWPEERDAALRSYIRIAQGLEAEDGNRAAAMYSEALHLAGTDDLRALAIERLGAMGGEEWIEIVEPYLGRGNDRLREAAATAVAPVALKMADQSNEGMQRAVPLLKEVIESSDHTDYVTITAARLRVAGYDVDVPVRKGYLKRFHVIGPFPGREELMKTDLIETDEPVDLSRKVEFRGDSCSWKYVPLDHIRGMLDLLTVVADSGDVGAYVYAEVESEIARRAEFRIGSDDDVYCWLNYEPVYSFEGGRGWQADQDRVGVHLIAGTNTILLKVLNGGGGWAVSLRIMDEDGHPLDLEQKGP